MANKRALALILFGILLVSIQAQLWGGQLGSSYLNTGLLNQAGLGNRGVLISGLSTVYPGMGWGQLGMPAISGINFGGLGINGLGLNNGFGGIPISTGMSWPVGAGNLGGMNGYPVFNGFPATGTNGYPAPITGNGYPTPINNTIPATANNGTNMNPVNTTDIFNNINNMFPNMTQPNMNMPNMTMPNMNLPNMNMPNMTMPEFTMPNINIPTMNKATPSTLRRRL